MGNSSPVGIRTQGQILGAYYDRQNYSVITVSKLGIECFNPETGAKTLGTPQRKRIMINCVDYTANENRLIIGDSDGRVRIYEAATGNLITTLPSETDVLLSPIQVVKRIDDKRVLLGTSDGDVKVWDLQTGQQLNVFEIPLREITTGEKEQQLEVRGITAVACCETTDTAFIGLTDGSLYSCDLLARSPPQIWNDGHTGQVLSLTYIASSNVVVSTSVDTLLKLWNPSTGTELGGYQFVAPCLYYDPVRDILFAGGDDGKYSLIKIMQDNGETKAKVIKRIEVQKSPTTLLSIFYHSDLDILVITSGTNRVQFWKDATGISYDEALQNSKYQKVNTTLSTDYVSELLSELQKPPPSIDFMQFPYIELEDGLLSLCSQLLCDDSDQTKERKTKMIEEFEKKKTEMKSTLISACTEYAAEAENLRLKNKGIIEPDLGRKLLEEDINARLDELKAQHERELRAFIEHTEQERSAYAELLPSRRRQVATELMGLKEKLRKYQKDCENTTAYQLRQHLLDQFPLIMDRYQIGNPVCPNATSVFLGLDLRSQELVAIKAYPASVRLDTALDHENLVPLRNICVDHAEDTTFVVMKLMKEDLRTYVERQSQKQLIPSIIVSIMYNLLCFFTYLHTQRMVFRDLRPSNILLDEAEQIRLTHFGVMRALNGEEAIEAGMTFAAPELFGEVVNTLSDMWSIGCVFAWLLQTPEEREIPLFYGEDAFTILKSMVEVVGKPTQESLDIMAKNLGNPSLVMPEEGKRRVFKVLELPSELSGSKPLERSVKHASEVELDLLKKMLSFCPQDRITAAEALKHAYFADHLKHL